MLHSTSPVLNGEKKVGVSGGESNSGDLSLPCTSKVSI